MLHAKYNKYNHFYAVIDQQWKITETDWAAWVGRQERSLSPLLKEAEACGWELCRTEPEQGAMGKLVFRRPLVQ